MPSTTSPSRRCAFARARVLLLATLTLCAALAAACSEDVPPGGRDGAPRDGDASSTEAGGGGMDGGGAACRADRDCRGGACIGGACCAINRVCGGACCGDGQQCFANACVTPGRECRTNRECEMGQYCETRFGRTGGGDVPDAGSDAGRCGATAEMGRCLAIPPACPAGTGGDAGAGDGGASTGCLPACEFRPTAGRLDAVLRWRWGPTAAQYPQFTDVWATPTVGRIADTNCDDVVDQLDTPAVVFVAGNARGNCCQCTGSTPTACRTGVLRALDGRTGREIWSLQTPGAGAPGFAGNSVALGDLDGNGTLDIVALAGDGRLVWVDGRMGTVRGLSDRPVPTAGQNIFGWGGGLAIADMDGDGAPEVAYGGMVFTARAGGFTHRFTATTGNGGTSLDAALSIFSNVDADPDLELVIGRAAHDPDGRALWNRTDLPDGFPAVGDFDRDGNPEVVMVATGRVWVLDGATGATRYGPFMLTGTGEGGPPTVADFDGDRAPEIGVAQQNYYAVLEVDTTARVIRQLWRTPNHDLSSSVTGSTVFDFEGDGTAEVIYNDECFLWVYDGATGRVRFATPTTSFTATEASLVADVDGDGHAEIVIIANGADPGPMGWGCNVAPWNAPDPAMNRPAWTPPAGAPAYRGIAVFGDSASSWVGTRSLWNQHSYHVTNICDDRDGACTPRGRYGAIPAREQSNWRLSWLNNFRQNVQESGLFDAPDAIVTLAAECASPVVLVAAVRNNGRATLPAGVRVEFYQRTGATDTLLGAGTTVGPLFPGQAAEVRFTTMVPGDMTTARFVARIVQMDPMRPTFRECRTDNNQSNEASPSCPG